MTKLEEHHRHPHNHGHDAHNCCCTHDHPSISHHGHDHSHDGSSGMIPSMVGILGFLIGTIFQHYNVSWTLWVFLVSAVITGYPVMRSGLRSLASGNGANINLLTSIAGIGAFFLGEYSEGLLVLTLFSVGEYLEELAERRASNSISSLLDLSPRIARVKRQAGWVEIPAKDVAMGDVVRVLPGERISADGTVLLGVSTVNESSITGESQPRFKSEGSRVFAGTINGEGVLEIEASKDAEDTTLAKILTMVQEAQSKRAKSDRLIDSFARVWTPSMILIAAMCAVLPPLLFDAPFDLWVYRGLTILLVSCPCSLVISTPVTVVGAIARGAKNGVLIKGGIHLESMAKIKAVAFDKTGTISLGKMQVSTIIPFRGLKENDALRIAASVESFSEHPLAVAMVQEAKKRGLEMVDAEGFTSHRGRGVSSSIENKNVFAGSDEFLKVLGITLDEESRLLARNLREKGETVVFLGDEEGILAILGLKDELRPEAQSAINEITGLGIESTMLTGDNEHTAKSVAGHLGFRSFRAGLLPEDKVNEIERLKKEYQSVAMVGDGVNDAPPLASATTGIAMGKGTDVALNTADIALMTEDLCKIPWVIMLSRKAMSLIFQNVVISLGLKLVALVLVLSGSLPLWLAVLTDSGAAVLVTLNALRILKTKLPGPS